MSLWATILPTKVGEVMLLSVGYLEVKTHLLCLREDLAFEGGRKQRSYTVIGAQVTLVP